MRYRRCAQFVWGGLGALVGSVSALADDTELYIYDYSQSGDYRPKVLLVFDNSGSMDDSLTVKTGYDSSVTYSATGSDNALDDDFIYFTVEGEDASNYVPDGRNEDKRFLSAINNCASSYEALEERGYYVTYMKEHRYQGNTGSWTDVRLNEGANYDVIDCADDFDLDADSSGRLAVAIGSATTLNPGKMRDGSAPPQGQMIDGANKRDESPAYYDLDATNGSAYRSGYVVTLFTANYIRWYYEEESSANTNTSTRLEVAQDAVVELAETSGNVDFGLIVFNYTSRGRTGSTSHGGRVVSRIQAYDDISTLTDLVTTLEADTWTPLTETLFEAKQYLSGGAVVFGEENASNIDPSADIDAMTGSGNSKRYISPFTGTCDDNVSIVYVTDGSPTTDDEADAAIQSLSVSTSENRACDGVSTVSQCSASYRTPFSFTDSRGDGDQTSLPILAAWMHDNDLVGSLEGRQTATLYTIGFGDDAIADAEDLLSEAATRGGGFYSSATDSLELKSALQQALIDTFENTSTLVSPAVTSNNFDRTQSLDRIYYSMFEPGYGPRWQGNLKKLVFSPLGYMVDKNGDPAIATDGSILSSATSYWSTSSDGNQVSEGGVVEMLSTKSDRTLLYSYEGSLVPFSKLNLEKSAGSASLLADHLGVDESEVSGLVNWIEGIDVDDEDADGITSDRRLDIMADPLHSTPLVINYGSTTDDASDTSKMDVRIVVATNAGVIHMFKDQGDVVDERWAFVEYDKLPNQRFLRANDPSTTHLYGIDGSPTVYLKDVNADGRYKFSDGDKVWMFVGQRRGGDKYYGFDISRPDTPSLMWTINADSAGMSELGQSWSKPSVGQIPGIDAPVLIFGGGYDVNKDLNAPGADTSGRGIFIVNAASGELVHSFTPGSSSSVNTQVAFPHAIAAPPTTLDSNGDGDIDRIYVGDTGGNVWRVDLPSIDSSGWGAIVFAALGGHGADDRRFFSEAVIVRTYHKSVSEVTLESGDTFFDYRQEPYDAVLIGSGDRTRPVSDLTVENHFFLLRDTHVTPTEFTEAPTPISLSSLYDISSNPLDGLTGDALVDERVRLSSAEGWYYALNEPGEKSLGAALVLGGDVYFTSYRPSVLECELTSIGTGRAYFINLHTGLNSFTSRYVDVENKVPDDLVLYSGEVYKRDENGDLITDADGNYLKTRQLRVFGGAVGESILVNDGDDTTTSECESSGNCAEGSQVDDMSLAPEQIYLYFNEAR
jgi:type IV pilus assembly protein PilY1